MEGSLPRSEFDKALEFLAARSVRCARVRSEREWNEFRRASRTKAWLYLIRWSPDRFCWGTATKGSDRLRKSSLFNSKLTGKYDRRVDYLILKFIHGSPEVHVFEAVGPPTLAEAALRDVFGQAHCYRGFAASNRDAIAKLIIEEFKETPHFQYLNAADRSAFEEYVNEVYLAKRWIPSRSGGRRTFHYGDSLEPNFLGRIGKAHLEPSIERVLLVRFN